MDFEKPTSHHPINNLQVITSDEETRLIGNDKDTKQWYFPARYTLAIWSFLGFMNLYILRINLNIAILAMVEPSKNVSHNSTEHPGNDDLTTWHLSEDRSPPTTTFDWTETQQTYALSAFFYGYTSTQILGGYLSRRHGGKMVLGLSMFFTSILAILTPLCASIGYWLFTTCRLVQGLLQGLAQPSMHAMWSKWAPRHEKSMLMTITFTGCQMGTIVATLGTGYLCESDFLGGWPSAFYVFGVAGILWSLSWIFFVHDTPERHPRISNFEKRYIESGVEFESTITEGYSHIRWLRVLTSGPMIAIIFAHIANDWCFFALNTSLPTYLHRVLRYDLTENGVLSSLPFVFLLVTSPLSGVIADSLIQRGICNTKNARKIVNSIGLFIPAGFIVAVCLVPTNRAAIVTLLTFAMGMSGFTTAGYSINHLDIAPSFASILYGITNTLGTSTGFIGPAILAGLSGQKEGWNIFFYLSAAIFFAGGLVFLLFAQGQPQSWAIPVIEVTNAISSAAPQQNTRNEHDGVIQRGSLLPKGSQ